MSMFTRLQRGWNAFVGRDPTKNQNDSSFYSSFTSYSRRPDRTVLNRSTERSIVNAIYNRIANDVAQVHLVHAVLDDNDKFIDIVKSKFNRCLNVEANLDQTGRAFILDIVLSMFDEGVVAVVPVDTTANPSVTTGYDILSMRVGKITGWFPDKVRVRLYDERDGVYKEINCPKRTVAIIENPFYTVMNEPNSTAKRLVRKLNLVDMMDEQNSSGKLDMIIKLPYVVKSEARRQQAEFRRKEIEKQLTSSQYGIAYTDGTEEIVQLNRPIENRLASQVKDLQADLYSQLGVTQNILNGSASEQELLNYYNRTIEPILAAIADEFKRKFLSKTAITQHQSVWFFRDPFKLVPVEKIASIADTFTRNEILTSNEVRAIVGYKPNSSPEADELRNKNLNRANNEAGLPYEQQYQEEYPEQEQYYEEEDQNG